MELPFNPGWIWIAAAAFLVIAEMFTVTFFLLWFGVAAAVAGVLALLGFGGAWQWGSFVVVSAVLFVYSRRFAEKFGGEQPPGVGANRLLGQVGMIIEDLDNDNLKGKIRLNREEWRAESIDGAKLTEGTKVKVIKVDGTHVVVEPIKEEV